MIEELANLPEVSFIENVSLDDIQEQMVNDYRTKYKELTGVEAHLPRADPIMLILYACSVQIYQALLYVDKTGKMDLLKYSYGEFLENVGALKGITREPAKPAAVTVRFTLSGKRPNTVAIPEGTRMTNGEVYFETAEYAEILPGETTVDVVCTCQTPGLKGNDILPDNINILVDPIAYVGSVSNIEKSAGGMDVEGDDSLAERIFIAPSRYSVAGPYEAYRYWVKTYNSSVLDIYVGSPVPGQVLVECILTDGTLPNEAFLQGLKDFLSDDTIRPLTDQVIVQAPSTVSFDIEVTYYIGRSDRARVNTIQSKVTAAVEEYKKWQCSKIGRDLNPSELTRKIRDAGAKRCVITKPEFTVIEKSAVPVAGKCTVSYGGLEDD